jgi:hypothetical protein
MIRADLWGLLTAAKWDTLSKYASYFCELPAFGRFPISGDATLQFGDFRNTTYTSDVINVQREYIVPETDHYALLLMKCEPNYPEETFDVKIDMVTMNPGGQHLSTQTVPLILVFYVLAVLYALLTIYWVGLCLYNM